MKKACSGPSLKDLYRALNRLSMIDQSIVCRAHVAGIYCTVRFCSTLTCVLQVLWWYLRLSWCTITLLYAGGRNSNRYSVQLFWRKRCSIQAPSCCATSVDTICGVTPRAALQSRGTESCSVLEVSSSHCSCKHGVMKAQPCRLAQQCHASACL